MQYVRRTSHGWVSSHIVKQSAALLAVLLAFCTNTYAASGDSRATLHISVILVTTITTPARARIEPTELATSENQDIIYNLRPATGQSAAEAIMSASQTEPPEKSLANLDNVSGEESVVEMTTVVMK